jgi:RNA polymerase sigma-70 factor (ECF subfamily)
MSGSPISLGPDPAGTRAALLDGLATLREYVTEAWWIVLRGDGTPHTRARTRVNEVPSRHVPPGMAGGGSNAGNQKPGRGGAPTRSVAPTQGGRPSQEATVPLDGETIDLEATRVIRQSPPPPPAPAPEKPAFPARPEPGDAAAEVWALVERAQAGEAEAFGLIYDRYLDTVFRFIYFRVGNRQLAEDLTADTFLRALKRIGSFTWQGRDLGAWLVTIARNLVADHFKSGRYRLEVTTGDVLDAEREERGPEGSPEAAVVDHITNVALLTAVKQLNPEQQECIVLRFLHGFSVAETALTMGKNEGAIKALQYRAVRALHRLLPEGFQP